MTAPATKPNIGPGAIADPGTPKGPAFILSGPEWLSIQTYVIDALALPTTAATFKTSLGPGAPSDLSDFDPLIAAYKAINSHVTVWQRSTFPSSVDLANDVKDYGLNKAPVYYPPILKEAKILEGDPNNADAKAALKAILTNLSTDAEARAKKAAAVRTAIQNFADQTQADKTTMVGKDGKTGLVKKYNDEYGAKSTEVEQINKNLKAQRKVLDAANKEYNHDVVVASTTPTYAWVWPFGTIAAAIVAGVYGHKAVEALDQVHAAQHKISTLSAQLAADANLMIAIHSAEAGMNQIDLALAAALPVIHKIEGIWTGIQGDLNNILKVIEDDIAKVPPIIMNLGVEEAVKAWYNVANAAAGYVVNAYVTVKKS